MENLSLLYFFSNKGASIPSKVQFKDYYFLFVLIALPSSFFALVNHEIFYVARAFDLGTLVFLLTIPLFVLNFPAFKKLLKISSGKAFIVLCFYLAINFYLSSEWRDIGFVETFTVFRKNFIFPFLALALLVFLCSVDNEKIYLYWRLVFIIGVIQAAVYILVNLTGINIYGSRVKSAIEYHGSILQYNLLAMPIYFHPIFSCSFLYYLSSKTKDLVNKSTKFWVLILIAQIFTFVRSYSIVLLVTIFLLSFFSKMKGLGTRLVIFVKFVFVSFVLILILSTIFSSHTAHYLDKWFVSESLREYTVDTGTYDFRLRLIEIAYNDVAYKNNIVVGNGYQRQSTPGKYDLALGGDTLIAPVLFCEGFLGLALRITPILILLFSNFKTLIFSKNNETLLLSLLSLSMIMASIINAVQTTIFTQYQITYVFLMSCEILKYNFRMSRKS